MPKWIQSMRAIAVLIFSVGILAALFTKSITGAEFVALANIPFVAYFAKRDEVK